MTRRRHRSRSRLLVVFVHIGNGFKVVRDGSSLRACSALREAERLSALIGEIYDAAIDPTLWLNVLKDTAGFVGGSAAVLFWKDLASRRGQEFYQHGHDPAYVRSYWDKYVNSTQPPVANCSLALATLSA